MMRSCWGVYRELAHSPGRETDDAEILRATAAELSAHGFAVTLKSPDELPAADDPDVPPFLFAMCERVGAVEKLAAWERRGARIVNRPSGIRNTDRERTIALFAGAAVPHPPSVLVDTAAATAFPGPCWVKRGDVHATEAGDVAYSGDAAALAAHLSRLSARGIGRAVVQDHVPGDLIKFYGVAGLSKPKPKRRRRRGRRGSSGSTTGIRSSSATPSTRMPWRGRPRGPRPLSDWKSTAATPSSRRTGPSPSSI